MKKRILAILLTLAVVFSGFSGIFVSAASTSELQNLHYMLNNSTDDVHIAYIGGSVTQGSGASSVDYCWASLVSNWFTEKYPDVTFTKTNGGIGATGSLFGSYRANTYLKLGTNPPDLLFIEFAINDAYDGRTETEVKRDMESMIVQTLNANPYANIVIVVTTDFAKKDSEFNAKKWHKEVAAHYGLPVVDVGAPLWQQVVAENGGTAPTAASDEAWRKYITDDCHPNDAGYALYAKTITDYLDAQLLGDTVTRDDSYTAKVLPDPLSSYVKYNGNYATLWDAGFRNQHLGDFAYIPNQVWAACDTDGGNFKFVFTGKSVGLWTCYNTSKAADIEYKVSRFSDGEVVASGTKSLYLHTNLTVPFELAVDLAEDTYVCDLTVRKSSHGSHAQFFSVWLDGNPKSVVPYMDVEATAKAAFNAYIAAKGNAATKSGMLTAVNTAISPYVASIASDDDYFIYPAVDGVYDTDTAYPISIPGHDGYVSAVFTVSDNTDTAIGTVGTVASIPHTEENLGTLTTDVYSADSTVFTTDANGNITGYSGKAEKIVIPASFSGTINLKDAAGKDSVKAIVIGDRSATKRNIRIANDSFKNWGSLRAVVLPKQIANTQGIGEAAFANNANLKYVNMPHSINGNGGSGYGYLNYGAFQNCVVLENAMCSCCGYQPSCSFFQNVYNNTAIRYVVTPQWCNNPSYTNISTHSFNEGEFVYLTFANNKKATLTRAATLAQEAAVKYVYSDGDSADTVKSEIVKAYSSKTVTSEITADWNDTFTVSDGKASGVLTLTQGDYSVPVEFNYNPNAGLNSLSVDGYEISPEFDAETYEYTLSVLGTVNSVNINVSPVVGAQADLTSGAYDLEVGENVFTINSKLASGTVVTYTLKITRQEIPTETLASIETAFRTYVDNKGNNAEPDALLSYINNAIAPASVEYDTDGIFIRHAVDGVYDENNDGYPIVIKGHDGSVAVNLKVYNKDGALVAYYGDLASIPHNEENLGELTYDIYDYDDAILGLSNFQIDADKNIIGYTGDAEKLIIPSDFAGKIAFTADSVTNKDNIKAVVIGGSDCASMTLNIANNSFNGWASLRAVELPRKINGRIGQFAFANNPVLKYVDTPASIVGSNGSGYGKFENEAFRDCPVLENINSNNGNGRMTTGQLWANIYLGTAVRDYIYEGWYQFGSGGSAANIAYSPSYSEGTQVILAAGGNGGTLTPTFTRAATMAQEKADTLTVTADNAASALTTITGTYSSKLTGVTAEWADAEYSGLVLTYGNYSITVLCNKATYNTAIGITMNSGVDYRFNAPSGVRFTYTVSGLDALLNDEGVADVKLGTLIAPADYISGNFTHFDLTNDGKAYLDIIAAYIKDGNTVSAVLSNIKEANYIREFSAIGYALITYTDGALKYVYADECVTVRPSSVAENVLESGASLTEEEKNELESMVATASAYTMNWIDTEYGSSDIQAMTMRNNILTSESASVDTSVYSGTTYRINEKNFETYKSQLSSLPEGSIVLFERGGTYRVGSIEVPNNNIYFGAYGEGAKPNIYGSVKNFAESTWTNESANVWSVSDITALNNNDAGIVIFDNGKMAGTKRATLEAVTSEGDFWYDSANDKVYLYMSGNPAELWNSIEIGVNSYIFSIIGKSGITIDNLNIRYTGAHGISIQGGSSNVSVTNCEIGYIGGSYMTHTSDSTVRFGNGVEIWCAASNVTVDNCWVHQIYDTGLTHQGTATVKSGSLFTQENITFSNNLIEYCAMASIEYWTSASGSATEYNLFKNITYSDNICRFAGYGFGTQGVSRTGYHLYTSKDALNAISADGNLDTLYVSGNIFDTSRGGLMQLAGCHYVSAMPQLSGNTYMQNNGGVLGILATEFSGGSTTATTTYYFDSDVESTIANIFKDSSATVIAY